jgi:hypothetical protein
VSDIGHVENYGMNTLMTALLLLGLCLALVMGLVSALEKLRPQSGEDALSVRERGPAFRDHSAGEHSADQQGSRSQFAWQSRSHSQPPD